MMEDIKKLTDQKNVLAQKVIELSSSPKKNMSVAR